MDDLDVLLMLLVFIGLPAVLIARSSRRLSAAPRHAQQLRAWAEARGWTYRGADPSLVGPWQVSPFTDADRSVDDALVGEHRGRAATTFRLEAEADEEDGSAFHVLTLALAHPQHPAQLACPIQGGPVVPPRIGEDVRARLREQDAAGMSVRVAEGHIVGWVAGEPIFSEITTRLDVLADVADLLEGTAAPSPDGTGVAPGEAR
ncbi:hypothetical protein V2J56_00565 [Georgenia sp. MJ206]|uniref:hypothetical protein n=1 Tax=Georgenia wangjunii TaxID=3117730 RepID=UPI002F264751